ncbi:MAG: sigma-70 family RNA polymerase sigma factor [bacterium]|nr:sigma-70 family RNA polymerase sigma factor [Candidatus Kapabacteria bacterium]
MATSRHSVEQEFEVEATPHLRDVYRAALRMTGDATDATDLAQEVYLQAWISFDRFERGTNCHAWLLAILFKKVQHYRRRKYNQRVVPLGADSDYRLEALVAPTSAPETITDEEILAALARIPESYRDAIVLADVHELSYKETADVLGVPIGTVMSRVSRGRKLLRIALADLAREFGIRKKNE